jgi:hypothetical protein
MEIKMKTQETVVVPQTVASSTTPETKVTDNSMPEDFKNDFFKHKERMKQAETRAQDLESRLKEYELLEEEKKGNASKVIEELKERSRKLETDLKSRDFLYAKGNIQHAIEQQAKDLGCLDVAAFTKLLGEEKMDIVSLDDNYKPSAEDIKMIVEDGMKQYEKIGLFGKNINLVDAIPNSRPMHTPEKSVGQMSKEELEKMIIDKFK